MKQIPTKLGSISSPINPKQLIAQMRITWIYPRQDSRVTTRHETFLGSQNPNLNLYLPTGGMDPTYCIT